MATGRPPSLRGSRSAERGSSQKSSSNGRRLARATAATAPARTLTRAALGIGEGAAPEAVGRRDAALRRLLMLADVLAALVAVMLALVVLGDDLLHPAALALLPVVVIASRLMGLYDRDEIVVSKTTLHEGPALFHLATLYTLTVYLGHDLFVEGKLRPVQGVGLWTAFFGCSVVCRALIRRVGVRYAEPERCLVLGDTERVERVRDKLRHGSASNSEVVLAVHPRQLPQDEARAVLTELVREHQIHRVILSTAELDNDRVLAIVRDMKALGVKVSVRPRLLDVVGSAVEFEHVHGDVFLGIRRFGLTRPEWHAKRTMDLLGSAAMLLMTAPLFAAIALAIRLDSRGPVFFRQERVGRDGRRFRIWKFRTMVTDAEERKHELAQENEAGGGLFKMADDPRVTRAGRLLRRTSLDELPQLLNVLCGEMSLVGPRPLIVAEDERIQGWHRRRLHLTPGMTGMWQVLGSARIPLHEMVALDYLYIVNWSIWNDVQILLRTIGFVLGRRGI